MTGNLPCLFLGRPQAEWPPTVYIYMEDCSANTLSRHSSSKVPMFKDHAPKNEPQCTALAGLGLRDIAIYLPLPPSDGIKVAVLKVAM